MKRIRSDWYLVVMGEHQERVGWWVSRATTDSPREKTCPTLHILLIEDNLDDIRLLEHAFRATETPIEITIMLDGPKALDFLSAPNLSCDLIILDLNLPGLNGFEVLEKIRASANTLPVIVMSSSTDESHIRESYQAGANSYISKPYRLDQLFAIANQIVARWAAKPRS